MRGTPSPIKGACFHLYNKPPIFLRGNGSLRPNVGRKRRGLIRRKDFEELVLKPMNSGARYHAIDFTEKLLA